MFGSHKEKKRTVKGGRKALAHRLPWEITSARGGGACNSVGRCINNSPHLFAPLWSEAAISDQSTDPCYLEDKVLFAHPDSTSCGLSAPVARAQLPALDWEMMDG